MDTQRHSAPLPSGQHSRLNNPNSESPRAKNRRRPFLLLIEVPLISMIGRTKLHKTNLLSLSVRPCVRLTDYDPLVRYPERSPSFHTKRSRTLSHQYLSYLMTTLAIVARLFDWESLKRKIFINRVESTLRRWLCSAQNLYCNLPAIHCHSFQKIMAKLFFASDRTSAVVVHRKTPFKTILPHPLLWRAYFVGWKMESRV